MTLRLEAIPHGLQKIAWATKYNDCLDDWLRVVLLFC